MELLQYCNINITDTYELRSSRNNLQSRHVVGNHISSRRNSYYLMVIFKGQELLTRFYGKFRLRNHFPSEAFEDCKNYERSGGICKGGTSYLYLRCIDSRYHTQKDRKKIFLLQRRRKDQGQRRNFTNQQTGHSSGLGKCMDLCPGQRTSAGYRI